MSRDDLPITAWSPPVSITSDIVVPLPDSVPQFAARIDDGTVAIITNIAAGEFSLLDY